MGQARSLSAIKDIGTLICLRGSDGPGFVLLARPVRLRTDHLDSFRIVSTGQPAGPARAAGRLALLESIIFISKGRLAAGGEGLGLAHHKAAAGRPRRSWQVPELLAQQRTPLTQVSTLKGLISCLQDDYLAALSSSTRTWASVLPTFSEACVSAPPQRAWPAFIRTSWLFPSGELNFAFASARE
jgi:hypothetical protein